MNPSQFSKKELSQLVFVDLTVEELAMVCVRLEDHIRRIDKELDRGKLSKQLSRDKESKANKLESIIEQIEASVYAQIHYTD